MLDTSQKLYNDCDLLQGGLDYGGMNDPYSHCQVKLKKYKTSENEQSHGSFFLRVGGLGE